MNSFIHQLLKVAKDILADYEKPSDSLVKKSLTNAAPIFEYEKEKVDGYKLQLVPRDSIKYTETHEGKEPYMPEVHYLWDMAKDNPSKIRPPILEKHGSIFYVRDGHHRVSVLKKYHDKIWAVVVDLSNSKTQKILQDLQKGYFGK